MPLGKDPDESGRGDDGRVRLEDETPRAVCQRHGLVRRAGQRGNLRLGVEGTRAKHRRAPSAGTSREVSKPRDQLATLPILPDPLPFRVVFPIQGGILVLCQV